MSLPWGQIEPVNPPSLEVLATELAKHIKSEQDIAALSRQLLNSNSHFGDDSLE